MARHPLRCPNRAAREEHGIDYGAHLKREVGQGGVDEWGQLMHGGDLGEIAWAFLARRLRAVKSRRLRRFAAGRVSFLTSDDRTAPRAQNVTAASR